jgi:hypothetical protein
MLTLTVFIILCIVYVLVVISMRPTLPYRLGDVFWRTDKEDIHYHTQMYPGTIASEYLKHSHVSENWDVLLNIIDKKKEEDQSPSVRLGFTCTNR